MANAVDGAARKKIWFTGNCYRYMFLLALLCSIGFIFISSSRTKYLMFYHIRRGLIGSAKFEMNCNIPRLHPMDVSIKQFVKYPTNIPRCLDPDRLPLDHNQTHIWIKRKFRDQTESLSNGSFVCCYSAFSRPADIADINKNVDDRVTYESCRNFTDTIEVRHEFVKANCSMVNSTIQQFFLFTPKKKFTSHDDVIEINKDASGYNVLVMGIDAVSRLNLYRTMPKTIQYLKNIGAVELSAYNKVGDNTFPNLIPMLLGISVQELKKTCHPHRKATFDNCPFIWEWFKQAGYYTALGEDSSWLGTFNYLRGGFVNTPTDYYLHTFLHEAETYIRHDKHFDFNSTSLCLNENYLYQMLLDYIENLTVSLNSSKLFGFFWEITMSHDNLNYPMVMDDDYVEFFEKFETSAYLKESIIFLVSDHGMRWGDIRSTKQGRIEERLPFVFILAPPKFRKKYRRAFKNLQSNSNRLTTPYDIHATLLDLVNLENISNTNIKNRKRSFYADKRGISLFLPIPINRTCEVAGISDHWCTCHKGYSIEKSSEEALEAASFLVKYMNSLLENHPECANLTVVDIKEATEIVVGKPDKKESSGWREYLLTMQTSPGGGVFEATVRNSSTLEWSVSGTVSRLNRFYNQSACIQVNDLQLYCYCK